MKAGQRRSTSIIVAISQVYPPDPASLGQHLADAASELARQGHEVIVFAPNHGYDDSTQRFPSRERLDDVEVRRVPFSSFGKSSITLRLVGALSLLLQAVWRTLFLPVDILIVSTSPAIGGLAGALLARLKGSRLVYWVMDLNPDQAIAQGIVAHGSVAVRVFEWMNRVVLRRADAIVAMDRQMAHRLTLKFDAASRIHVIAPWPLEDHITPIPREGNPFRTMHGLQDKFVIMYSGNLSAVNPLRTLIDAAIAMQHDPRFAFVFIGGGSGKAEVEEAGASNILSLPYQPRGTLTYSLGAADLHVVTMGAHLVGITHPCKVYGALAAARPILFIGPHASHVSDLLARAHVGWHVFHGDVAGAVSCIREASSLPPDEYNAMGARAHKLIDREFSKARLCTRFCEVALGQ